MRCVILLCLASCFPLMSGSRSEEPPDETFGRYVAMARHEDAELHLYIGRLQSFEHGVDLGETSTDFDPGARSTDDMANLSLYYDGIADGRICFRDSVRGAKTYDSADDYARYDLGLHIVIEAHDDLAAIAARPLQPAPGTALDTFEVTRDEVVDKDTDYGTIERERQIGWKVCGPAPEITPQTRYVTATFHDSDINKDGLLIWELVDATPVGPGQ